VNVSEFLGIPDEKSQQSLSERGTDNRYITNDSLIIKSRQQENKNSYGHDRRFSYNNEMSDSTVVVPHEDCLAQ
jgi:hypothetical protein